MAFNDSELGGNSSNSNNVSEAEDEGEDRKVGKGCKIYPKKGCDIPHTDKLSKGWVKPHFFKTITLLIKGFLCRAVLVLANILLTSEICPCVHVK